MMDIKENKLMTVKEVCEEFPDFSTQKINQNIREGRLIAKKIGTKYYINRKNLYEFLGLEEEEDTEENKKDKLIAELKNEIRQYKEKLLIMQNVLNTCGNLEA